MKKHPEDNLEMIFLFTVVIVNRIISEHNTVLIAISFNKNFSEINLLAELSQM